jgi:hypothetical protein
MNKNNYFQFLSRNLFIKIIISFACFVLITTLFYFLSTENSEQISSIEVVQNEVKRTTKKDNQAEDSKEEEEIEQTTISTTTTTTTTSAPTSRNNEFVFSETYMTSPERLARIFNETETLPQDEFSEDFNRTFIPSLVIDYYLKWKVLAKKKEK